MAIKNIRLFLWNGLDQLGSQIINLLLGLVLLRYLSPQDFGMFVIPFLVYNLCKSLQDLGSHDLIYLDKGLDYQLLQKILGFSLIVSGVIATIVYLMPIDFYRIFSKSYLTDKKIILCLIPLLFFTAFNLTAEFYFRKKIYFKEIATTNILATLIAGLVGIYLAQNGLGVWSLVYKQMIYVILFFVLMLWYTKGVIFPSFEVRQVWRQRSFFLPLVNTQLLSFASRNIDNLLIGKYLGLNSLGIYDRSYKFLTAPLSQIGGSIYKVILPIFSKLKNNKIKTYWIFFNVLQIISFFIFPVLTLLSFLAHEFVVLFLGDKWIDAIPIIRIFMLTACIQSLGGINYGVIILNNKTASYQNLMTTFNLIYFFIFFYFTSISPNLINLVIFYCIASSIFNVWVFQYATTYFDKSIIQVLSFCFKPILVTILMIVYISILKSIISIENIITFMFCFGSGLLLYGLMFILLFRQTISSSINFLKDFNRDPEIY